MSDMHDIVKLKEMLIEELKGYGQNKSLSTGSLEMIDKLAHAIKNLCKIVESGDEERYSNADNSYRMSRRGSYADDASYRRDSMGRYSRDYGYSRADEKEEELRDIVNQLRSMAKDLPQPTQRAIQNFTDMVG